MNQLAEYNSDDDSPYGSRSEDEQSVVERDETKQISSDKDEEMVRKDKRRNSEYWTDESGNGSSSSLRTNSDSGSEKDDSESLRPPISKKPSLSPIRSAAQADFVSSTTPTGHLIRPFASKSALSVTQSQNSLVSYSGQEDEEDQFAKADRKAVANKQAQNKGSSESTNREPKPPPGHEDSRSPDEIAVDSAAEGLRELERHRTDRSFIGNLTPKSLEGNDSPSTHDEPVEIRLPPSPTAKCPVDLEARFRGFFEKKAQGADLNALIQRRRDFKNPSMYEKLIEKFEVDELGSNFAPSVFDPHGFTKDCFYDQISILQKEAMEKYNAATEKKAANAAAAAAASISAKAAEAKRKSRFEGSKK